MKELSVPANPNLSPPGDTGRVFFLSQGALRSPVTPVVDPPSSDD